MCGIAGLSWAEPERIEKMLHALLHRGPDGHAVCTEHGVSLGHARLAILDPSERGTQPMWNKDRTVAIVYNGEIFNYRELRERYSLQTETGTDTEVLLKLYEEQGMGFVSELLGMFAFAIFDTRTETWYLARDPSGIKPLYLAYPNGKLAFASELRALLHAFDAKPALNLTSLSRYMRLQYVPGPQTLCEGIESMAPGTVLSWKHGESSVQKVQPNASATLFSSRSECIARLPELMDGIVKDHLVSDKPVGMYLSGGMDSSIVLHHMAAHMEEQIRTFTVRFDVTDAEQAERFNKDADLAKMTAEHYGTVHTEVVLTADACRETYRETARLLDQPNANTVTTPMYALAARAKQDVDVVLCGTGGDELFYGAPRQRIAHILHMLRWMPPALRSGLGKLGGYPPDVLGMNPGSIEFAERFIARPADEVVEIATGDWFARDAVTLYVQEHYATLPSLPAPERLMHYERETWMVDDSLRLTDAMTMAHGLECRVPLLDPRMIATALPLPRTWSVSARNTKTLLKDAYRGTLPAHLYSLDKASFFTPLAKWLRRECKGLIEDMLDGTQIREYFDVDAIEKVAQKHQDASKYGLHVLSALIVLNYWFEEVYEGQG